MDPSGLREREREREREGTKGRGRKKRRRKKENIFSRFKHPHKSFKEHFKEERDNGSPLVPRIINN
jgi:hypothetical protein